MFFEESSSGTRFEIFFKIKSGGRGIRTPDNLSIIHAFQACALVHYAIPPFASVMILSSLYQVCRVANRYAYRVIIASQFMICIKRREAVQ